MLVIYSSGFRSKNVKLVDIAVAGHKMTDDSLSEDLVFFAFFCIIFLMHFFYYLFRICNYFIVSVLSFRARVIEQLLRFQSDWLCFCHEWVRFGSDTVLVWFYGCMSSLSAQCFEFEETRGQRKCKNFCIL